MPDVDKPTADGRPGAADASGHYDPRPEEYDAEF
jgi:hypothetical protein